MKNRWIVLGIWVSCQAPGVRSRNCLTQRQNRERAVYPLPITPSRVELSDKSRVDLCGLAALLNYLKLYPPIPLRAIGAKTPIQTRKEWQQKKPYLFLKRVYD